MSGSSVLQRYGEFDYSDYAQEFLRRNVDYRTHFAELASIGDSVTRSLADRRAARSWGLEFHDRPLSVG